jgi:hypothetical protein
MSVPIGPPGPGPAAPPTTGEAMSAPTPTWRRTPSPAARPAVRPPERDTERDARTSRSAFDTALDVTARLGTAVTLAALLVLTGTVLGLADAVPPAASAGR